MKTRIITAAVGLGVLAVVLAFFDTFLFDLVLSAVCLIAIHEVFSAMGFGKKQWYLYAAAVPLTLLVMLSTSQMVRGLLDGGVADSIPIRFFESIGYKRNLIILTQPKGFVKKKNPMLPAIRARYLRYPAFVAAVADRHERYNETLSYIAMQESTGRDFVIRPPIPLEIGAMERDPAQLRRVYETGRAVAQIQVDKIRAFLETAKAEAEE